MDLRRKMIDLQVQRTNFLSAAEGFLEAGKQAEYQAEMEKVQNLNKELDGIQALLKEKEKAFLNAPVDKAVEKDKALERAELLKKGESVSFSAGETLKSLYQASKQVTLATGQIVQPTGAGSNIRDPLGNVVSSIVDEVYVQDLTGMGAFLEPYVISELDAKGGKVKTNAGTARTASTDPTFGVAKISPYELNVTAYVDRNISRLSPASYYEKIRSMAMRAMRRKISELIIKGDGQGSPDMFGIVNAKNTDSSEIFAKLEVSGISDTLLTELFFAYGGDEAIGANARLYLNKKDLAALGKIRGTSDKKRVFEIRPDGNNPNRGTIVDGGTVIPYSINSFVTALEGAGTSTATMIYGDPMNYELGLFGEYSVRVDESIKGTERMLTILGDVMVGGNVIVNHGFVVATTGDG